MERKVSGMYVGYAPHGDSVVIDGLKQFGIDFFVFQNCNLTWSV